MSKGWPHRLATLVCQLPLNPAIKLRVWAGDSTDSCISSELGISTAMQRFVFWTLTLSLGNGLLQWALKHPGKEEFRRGMAWSRVNAQVSVSVWFGSPWAHTAFRKRWPKMSPRIDTWRVDPSIDPHWFASVANTSDAKDGRLGFQFIQEHVVREHRVYRKHSNAACVLCFCC